jgi:hypothetical protein
MTCPLCGNKGIVLLCYRESKDYDAMACTCKKGLYWRTRDQLKAWAANQTPKPSRIGGLEDFYTEKAIEELRTATDLDQDIGGPPQPVEFERKAVTADR